MAELANVVDVSVDSVPVEMLDYSYVGSCTDIKLLEKILAVLKSGKEGIYPELIKYTEEKYVDLLPLKEKKRYYALNHQTTPSERLEAEQDLLQWVDSANKTDQMVLVKSVKREVPVRGTAGKTVETKSSVTSCEMTMSETVKEFPLLSKTQAMKIMSLRRELRVADFSEIQRSHSANQEKLKGNECFKLNENDKAVLHYSKSIAFDDSKAPIWANRAMAYIRLELFNYAEEDCSMALSMDATYVKALFRRGLVRFKMGRYAESIADFGNAMILDSDNLELAKLWKAAVDKYSEIPDSSDSNITIVHLTQTDPIFPSSLESWDCVSEGVAAANSTQSLIGVPVYRESSCVVDIDEVAVQLSQKETMSVKYKDLGNKLIDSPRRAIRMYKLSVRCNRTFVPSLNNLAQVQLSLKNYEEVIAHSTTVLNLEPKNVKALYRRASAFFALRKIDESLHDCVLLLNADRSNILAVRLYVDVVLTRAIQSLDTFAFANAIAECSSLLTFIDNNAEFSNQKSRALLIRAKSYNSTDSLELALADLAKLEESSPEVEALKVSIKARLSVVPCEVAPESLERVSDVSRLSSEPVLCNTETIATPTKRESSKQILVSPSPGPVTPLHPPRTVYEFERVWRSLKNNSALFAEYLLIFKENTFQKVIKESTSEECLSSIFRAWRDHVNPECRLQSMLNFSKVSGFSFMLSMLPLEDLKCIQLSISDLQKSGVDKTKLVNLCSLYDV